MKPTEMLDLVLSMMHAASQTPEREEHAAREDRRWLVRWLSPVAESLARGIGASGQVAQRLSEVASKPAVVTVAGAADAAWPPPYAAAKGFTQDVVDGFAFTVSAGAAFVHMRPIVKLGANAEQLALAELARVLAIAVSTTDAKLAAMRAASVPPSAPVPAGGLIQQLESDIAAEEQARAAVAADDERCTNERNGFRCLLDAGHEPQPCAFATVWGASS